MQRGRPEEAKPDFSGRTLIGKYKIVELLGSGGMASVWRGTHLRTGRKVAVKVLDERYLENASIVKRFGREARAASAVQHPGIVEVLDIDYTPEGIPFLVMEFVEGDTLSQRIEHQGRLTQDEAVAIMIPLLEALDAAHLGGVVHRDLKPDNIVLVKGAQDRELVKILDFGISQKADEAATNLTLEGSVLGTPHYMAPEQALGESDIDGRADVYAAGVVFYECVVGDVPFDAPNYNRLLQIILRDEIVPPRQRGAVITKAVERVMLQALTKERERRLSSAGEFMQRLIEAVQLPEMESDYEFDRSGEHEKVTRSMPSPFPLSSVNAPLDWSSIPPIQNASFAPEIERTSSPPPPRPEHLFSEPVHHGYLSDMRFAEEAQQEPPNFEVDERALARARTSTPPLPMRSGVGSFPPHSDIGAERHHPGLRAPAKAPASRQFLLYALATLAIVILLIIGVRALVRSAQEDAVVPSTETNPHDVAFPDTRN